MEVKDMEIAETENLPFSRLSPIHHPQTHMPTDRSFIVICCAAFRIFCTHYLVYFPRKWKFRVVGNSFLYFHFTVGEVLELRERPLG
jgi:hypothetical protein